MAQIPKGGTLVPGGATFPVIREAVYASTLVNLNAMDPAQLYLGMIGIAADFPGTIYIATSLSPLIWTPFSAAATTGKLKDTVVAASITNRALTGLTPSIDGITPTAGDRVLLKNQTTISQNGIYVASAGAWTRAADFDTATQATVYGAFVPVNLGTTNAGTMWIVSAPTPTIVLGTTVLTFTETAAFQPSPSVPALVVATTSSRGVAKNYARGDHVHGILATTLNPLAFAWTNTHTFASTATFSSTVAINNRLQFAPQNFTLNSVNPTVVLTSPFLKVTSTSFGLFIGIMNTGIDGMIVHIMNVGTIQVRLYAGGGGANVAGYRELEQNQIATYLYNATSGTWNEVVKSVPATLGILWSYPDAIKTADFTPSLTQTGTTFSGLTNRIDPTLGPILAYSQTGFGGTEGVQVKFQNVSASTNPITIRLGNGINEIGRDYIMTGAYQSVTMENMAGLPFGSPWMVVAEAGKPTSLPPFSDATRPSPFSTPVGYAIFNTDDNAPNFCDGSSWRDALGMVT